MSPQELDFAYKVRRALNESIDHLPSHVVDSLESSRKIAVSRKKQDSPLRVLAGQPALAGGLRSLFAEPGAYWLGRLATFATLAALVGGLMGIYHHETQKQIRETAEMDIAVLADELPPNAYLDPGFKQYLHK